MTPVEVSVIMPTFRRSGQIVKTLSEILLCAPPPAEILVFVDGDDEKTVRLLADQFPDVVMLQSTERMGPGGARNQLIAAAKHHIVASFDDDSYPIDRDYFARLIGLFERYPEAAVVTTEVFVRGQIPPEDSNQLWWVSDFIGCGCAYQRSLFLETRGYVPLAVAYGMEEVDIALQLHALGNRILKAASLRVFHDTDYSGHVSPKLVSGTIANLALLAYLRYPLSSWPRGILQLINLVRDTLCRRRYRGIISGLLMILPRLRRYRQHRGTVSSAALDSFLKLRRNPQQVG